MENTCDITNLYSEILNLINGLEFKFYYIPATEPLWFCIVSCDVFPTPEFKTEGNDAKLEFVCLDILLFYVSQSCVSSVLLFKIKRVHYNKSFNKNSYITHYSHYPIIYRILIITFTL